MSPVSAPLLAPRQSPVSDREQLAEAARKFEAIFLRQMLAAARKTDFGGDLMGGEGLKTFRTMQDEHFADMASQSGAFGLAAAIEAQLARHLGATSARGLRQAQAERTGERDPIPAQAELILSLSRDEAHALPSTQRGRN